MTRVYSVTNATTVSDIIDIVEIRNGASHISIIHSFLFGQSSDAGDAESEQLAINIFRPTAAGSSGSAAHNIISHKSGDVAARSEIASYSGGGATVAGSPVLIDSFNVMAGAFHKFTPEERITVAPNSSLVFALATVPNDVISTNFTLTWEEIGG